MILKPKKWGNLNHNAIEKYVLLDYNKNIG